MLIPKSVFNVAAVASKYAGGRYGTDKVRLERDERGKPWAVATDGRRLLSVTWIEVPAEADWTEKADPKNVIGFNALAGAEVFAKIGKTVPDGKTVRAAYKCAHLTETNEGGEFATVDKHGNTNTTSVGHDKSLFPDWRKVVPRFADKGTVSFYINPELLADLLTAMARTTAAEDSGHAVKVTVSDNPNAPILLEGFNNAGTLTTGVIMPVSLPDSNTGDAHDRARALHAGGNNAGKK